jgi:hypothetical protein
LYKTAIADAGGGFTLNGVAPGEYKLFAWESLSGDSYTNETFMKDYESQGQPIAVSQGESVSANVLVISR